MKKEIIKQAWISKNILSDDDRLRDDVRIELDEPIPTLQDLYYPATITMEIHVYKLFIKDRQIPISGPSDGFVHKYHLTNNDSDRVPFNDFMQIINRLKKAFPNDYSLNWHTYAGQPIYEFQVELKAMMVLISEINPHIITELIE